MKKVFLLCALVCASQLYGMEPEQKPQSWNILPRDVQILIIQALYSNDNPDEAIRAIIAMSRTNKAVNQLIHGDIKSFTALVDLLEKKFPKMARQEIAKKFNTSIAKEYVELGRQLMSLGFDLQYGPSDIPIINAIKALITQENADPNYSAEYDYSKGRGIILMSVYSKAISDKVFKCFGKDENLIDLLKFLLNAGAKHVELIMPELNELLERYASENTHPRYILWRELYDLFKPYAEK